jgi:hypothetical protein
MEAMRKSWTDERLDDFAAHSDRRFDAVEKRMSEGFGRVDKDIRELRVEMDARFDRLDARFDAFQRTMLQIGGGMIVGLIATQL